MVIRYIKRGRTIEQKADADAQVEATVRGILADIAARKDEAVRALSAKFDNWSPPSFKLSDKQIQETIGAPARTGDRRYQIRPGASPQFRAGAAGGAPGC